MEFSIHTNLPKVGRRSSEDMNSKYRSKGYIKHAHAVSSILINLYEFNIPSIHVQSTLQYGVVNSYEFY